MFEDLTGKVFNNWTVLELGKSSPRQSRMWKCRCECGMEGLVRTDHLRSGRSKSCGCLIRSTAGQKRTQFEDQIRGLRRELKNTQRQNSLFEALAEQLQIKPFPPLPSIPLEYKGDEVEEDVVLHLSDEHCDHNIKSISVGGLEQYNFQIALGRAEILTDKIVKWCFGTLSNFKFKRLYILANGDHVNGEIHNSIQVSEWKSAFKSAINCGKMHALILRDLAPYFPEIHIIYTSGNHGRRSQKKDFENPHDNWDYLVAEVARLSCTNIPNVYFQIPEAFSYVIDINGHNFYVAHGDDIKSWGGIPFYGIQRKTMRLSALLSNTEKKPQYYCFGHFHQPSSLSNLDGEILVNGAWLATTPYVYESLSGYTEPSQLFHGVHKKHGISWRLNLYLRDRGIAYKPMRYKI